jgi:hypothetical protein
MARAEPSPIPDRVTSEVVDTLIVSSGLVLPVGGRACVEARPRCYQPGAVSVPGSNG